MTGSCVQAFLTMPELWVLARRIVRSVPCHMLMSTGTWPEWHLQRYTLGAVPPSDKRWTIHFLLDASVDSPIGTNPNLGPRDLASGPLYLRCGPLQTCVLEESVCGFKTERTVAIAAWRPILAWLRRNTMCGAVAKSADDSLVVEYKTCRYSSGAVAAFNSGVVLKQMRQQPFWLEPRPSKHIEFPRE
jgi:hypothetical protein